MSNSLRQQRTLARSVEVVGFGYWSGRDVRLEFRPAEPDTGIVFVRGDLPSPVRIPATVDHRLEMPRRTTLSVGAATVEMVEHIMAALAGLQIDNCEVWTDQPEMPGCDGSSLAFVEAIDAAGAVEQPAIRAQLVVTEVTRVGNEETWVEARPATRPGAMSLRCRIDYGRDSAIGKQTFQQRITPASFRNELAPARTFLLKEEADWLIAQGKGSRATTQDLLVYGPEGPIDNELRFEDECVRHKSLDMVGDLALAGCDLVGHFVAHCSGHRLNAELLREVIKEGQVIDDAHRIA